MKWRVRHARSLVNAREVLAEGWLVTLYVNGLDHGTGAWFPRWRDAAAFAFSTDPGRFR